MRGRKQSRYQPNQRVEQWTLIRYEKGSEAGDTGPRVKGRWVCQCDCGVIRSVLADNLANGESKSCGHGKKGGTAARNAAPVSSVFALGAQA